MGAESPVLKVDYIATDSGKTQYISEYVVIVNNCSIVG